MNKFFDNYKSGFDPYKLDVNAAYEFKTMSMVVRDGKVIAESHTPRPDKSGHPSQEGNTIVNLASTSKPFTMDLLSKVMNEDKFIATLDLIKELIFRKQNKHLEENSSYKDVLIWLSKNKISNPKSKLRALVIGNDAGLYNWKADGFPEIVIDFKELCFNALTLSSNSAIEIARNKLQEILGSNVQVEFDKLQIAPTLELHSGGFKLLNQQRANSGDLKEIVLSFDKLISSSDDRLLNAMHNNPVYFDVGVSKMIKDCDVWEKTGVAWPINYGDSLSELGFPPHMVMGTLFSIKENDTLTSFGIFKVIAIAVPKTKDSNGFPNIYEKNYTTYINLVKYKFLKDYRRQLTDLVERNTSVKLSSSTNIGSLLKQQAMKLKMLL
ncbi:MAG: hypothetical protein ABIM99_04105 [Candidatus Dojkabacteria bacterium]